MQGSDINKQLLSHFYGINEESQITKFLSSSKGIEDFEMLNDKDSVPIKHIRLSESNEKQNTEKNSAKIDNGYKECNLIKSRHIITIKELLQESESDSQSIYLEADASDGTTDDENDQTKYLIKLEDLFSKGKTKTSDVSADLYSNSVENVCNLTLPYHPLIKAKNVWQQKSRYSKEKIFTSFNYMSRLNDLHLDLNNFGICQFPVEILQLTNLKVLYLDFNHLFKIPEEIFTTLKNLTWLDIRNNQLSILPNSIKGHPSLETLLLQGNNIQRLPLELGLVPNLKNLQTAHNPLTFPPQNILDLDCSGIINFLRLEWNKEYPSEIIELKKINSDKIKKKSSTILCYEPISRKSVKSNTGSSFENAAKTSVRTRSWNYKPSSRYGYNSSTLTLKKIENFETNLNTSFIISNACASSLYRKGDFVENVLKIGYCYNDCKKGSIDTFKKNSLVTYHRTNVSLEKANTNSNILHLLGPSPRSAFLRKNINIFTNIQRNGKKLCKIKHIVFNYKAKKVKTKNARIVKDSNIKEKAFYIKTNDGTQIKIKPMQIKNPEMIIRFLNSFLVL